MSHFSVCYVTAPSAAVAEAIAARIVTSRAAACVNIVPGVTSVYTWQGKVEKEQEHLMMIKTQTAVVPRLIQEVRAAHPYDVPEVISVPMGEGSEPYLDWVRSNTALQAPPQQEDNGATAAQKPASPSDGS